MASGLPVIATGQGGMIEMIEDGRTGWIAPSPDRDGLADALRRALETPASVLAEMGREAAASIHRICDNDTIVQRQLEFRARLVTRNGTRSAPMRDQPGPFSKAAFATSNRGIGITVTCFNHGRKLDESLASVVQQTSKAYDVVIVDAGSTDMETLSALDQAQRDGWKVIRLRPGTAECPENIGLGGIHDLARRPLAVAFLQSGDRLLPEYVDICERVLLQNDQIGLISSWALDRTQQGSFWSRPTPGFPYQWLSNDLVPFSAIRTAALAKGIRFKAGMDRDSALWDLFDTLMASGWKAVTIPQILGEASFRQAAKPYMPDPYRPVRGIG